eukprot:CAMPEP_0202968646 /NCGR_PEP_ID=MMETSP1396-20130829/14019_1 /ASSEMBLY_ACC=CAM_ASM_000872 /TAXON_ID= /ORGANISM="Pseudokeronopsis sp., Strain Brazil" /LENGTH=254 /DNA_ID=CAMNT_0049695191 /DNA_START=44 /DNA_END=808 /DNA_ORIENTATION=-
MIFYNLALVVLTFIGVAAKKATTGEIQRKDLDYIKCDVCKRVSFELVQAINSARKTSPKNRIGEFQIVDIMDNVCKPRNLTVGAWARHLDIVETKRDGKVFLDLEYHEDKQNCNRECATLAKSCDSLLESEIDADDFSAYLYRTDLTPQILENKLCQKLTSRCARAKSALPENHSREDEPFIPMDEKQAKAEELSAMMKEAGIKGDLRQREDMEQMFDEYADDFEDDRSHLQRKAPFAPPGYARNSHEKLDDDL